MKITTISSALVILFFSAFIARTAVFAATDTTAPTVGSVSPTYGTPGVSTTFTTSYSDNVGVTACGFTIGGHDAGQATLSAGIATIAYTLSQDSDGETTGSFSCFDAAGNEGDGSLTTIALLPAVGSVTPTSLTVGQATTMSATYADDAGIRNCTLYVNGVGQGTMSLSTSTSGTASKSYTASSAGTLSVYVSCLDNYANVGIGSTVSVTATSAADTTAPTVGTISPTTATAGTAATFSASYSDAVGVTGCTLSIGGVSQGAMTLAGTTSGTATKSYTFSSAGTSNAKATCVDAAGNSKSGTVVSVVVSSSSSSSSESSDTTSESADVTAPTVGSVTPTTAVEDVSKTFSVSYSDTVGVTSCTAYADGSSVGSMTLSSGTASLSTSFSTSGSHSMYATCTDAAGNVGTGSATTITVSSAPTMTVGSATANTLLKLACISDTDVNGPCKAVYYYDGEKRHAFPNEAVFFTWYDDFDDVITVTNEFMASITLGSNVTYHPGTTMAKFMTVNTVYAVGEQGELRAIDSEATARSLYGDDWNQQIDDISDAFFGNYDFGANITSSSDYDPEAVEASVTSIDEIL